MSGNDEEKGGPPPEKEKCPKCKTGNLELVDASKLCDECNYVVPKPQPTWRDARAQKYLEDSPNVFQTEVMRYLKNTSAKVTRTMNDVMSIKDKQDTLTSQVETLQATIFALGQSNGTAYKQLKRVVNSLGESTRQVVVDLSDAMGNIRFVDWETYEDL